MPWLQLRFAILRQFDSSADRPCGACASDRRDFEKASSIKLKDISISCKTPSAWFTSSLRDDVPDFPGVKNVPTNKPSLSSVHWFASGRFRHVGTRHSIAEMSAGKGWGGTCWRDYRRRGEGRTLAVCRISYQGGVHPGKLILGRNCNIGRGVREIGVPKYEIMVVNSSPIATSASQAPAQAQAKAQADAQAAKE